MARTGLMDTPPEEEFDRLTRLVTVVLDTPLAFVTVVDEHRSFWKSCVGLDVTELEQRQLPVEESLCHYGVSTGNELIVEDTRRDDRTSAATPVRAMGVQAWASFPLHTPDGEVIGSFCVGDLRPRAWSAKEISILQALTAAAESEIALRDAASQAMSLARAFQESLIPPAVSDLPGFEVAAAYLAATDGTKLVGDFFDVFESARGSWHVVMGDVAGHGPQAAMIAARMRYAIRSAAAHCEGPGEALANINEVLLSVGPQARLATMTLVNVAGKGKLRIVTAGHPPPVISATGTRATFLPTSGPLLGAFVFSAAALREVELELAPGETILLYTDGVTDAGRRSGSALDQHGLLACLDELRGQRPEEVVRHLERIIVERSGGALADDATMLLIRRR